MIPASSLKIERQSDLVTAFSNVRAINVEGKGERDPLSQFLQETYGQL